MLEMEQFSTVREDSSQGSYHHIFTYLSEDETLRVARLVR